MVPSKRKLSWSFGRFCKQRVAFTRTLKEGGKHERMMKHGDVEREIVFSGEQSKQPECPRNDDPWYQTTGDAL